MFTFRLIEGIFCLPKEPLSLFLSPDNAYAYMILLSSLPRSLALWLDIGLSEAIKREVSQRVNNFPPSGKQKTGHGHNFGKRRRLSLAIESIERVGELARREND